MPTADHNWDLIKHEPSPRHQKRAVSELVGYLHGLISGGVFSPEIAKQVHTRVRQVCIEFDMQSPPAPTSSNQREPA